MKVDRYEYVIQLGDNKKKKVLLPKLCALDLMTQVMNDFPDEAKKHFQ